MQDERASQSTSAAGSIDGVERHPLSGAGRELAAILALSLALQIVAWVMQRGYPIADVVEYLERARHWVLGAQVGGDDTIRSFAFSALFAPLFALDRWLGLEDSRWIMPAARCLQVAIGLGFVLAVARFGASLGGRRAGLAAGVLAAANPIFLLHAVWPLADVAAAACLALGLEVFLTRRGARRELVGGLWLGLAFLFAYKTLPVILLVGLWCLARDRWRHPSSSLGLAGGVALAVLVQVALDRWIYGEWGGTLWRYVVDNAGSAITTALMRLDLVDAARSVYRLQSELSDFTMREVEPSTRQLMSKGWYLEHLHEFLSLPALLLFAFGLARAARLRVRAALLLVVCIVVHAMLTSFKGDKSFRLWMPILPAVAALGGLGAEHLWRAPASRWRAALATALLLLVVVLAPSGIQRQTPRRYAAFWDAMDLVNRVAREHPTRSGRDLRVASSFYWGPYLRNEPKVELVRVWPPLERFARLGPGIRRSVVQQLDSLDGLMLHAALLAATPELVALVGARFRVIAAFHDPTTGDRPGPLLLLARPRATLPGEPLLESEHPADAASYASARGFAAPLAFVARQGEREERVALLGVECRPLEGSGARWLVYHWRAETDLELSWRVRTRERGSDGGWRASDERPLGWSQLPAQSRARGAVLREGRLLLDEPSVAGDRELWLALELATVEPGAQGSGGGADSEAAGARAQPEGGAADADGFVRAATIPR